MAAPTLTYTLTNGTTADASQVMQDFNDLLNGITDASKDLTINALTLTGALVVNGNTTLGDFSTDDITVNGSLASTIPIKTNNSFNIGSSTLGLASVYLGSAGGFTTRLVGGATTSYTMTTPVAVGAARSRVLASATAALTFEEVRGSYTLHNYGLTATVAASALTIALKGADGNDPSSTNVVEMGFRSATATTGTPLNRTATAATSVVVSSGSTLGTTSAVAANLYVYALDNAGTVELGVSSSLFDEGSRQSSTAEGGAGAADSNAVLYSTTTRTNVGIRLIGRLSSTQATAGTWATAIAEISLLPFASDIVAMRATTAATSVASTSVDVLVIFSVVSHDTHGAYNSSTGFWTAPRSGYARVTASITGGAVAVTKAKQLIARLYKNTSAGTLLAQFYSQTQATDTYTPNAFGSDVIKVVTGDTLAIYANNNIGSTVVLDSSATANVFTVTMV